MLQPPGLVRHDLHMSSDIMAEVPVNISKTCNFTADLLPNSNQICQVPEHIHPRLRKCALFLALHLNYSAHLTPGPHDGNCNHEFGPITDRTEFRYFLRIPCDNSFLPLL